MQDRHREISMNADRFCRATDGRDGLPLGRLPTSDLAQGHAPVVSLYWGPEFVMLYNDSLLPMVGANKHPQAMGRPAFEVLPEIRSIIEPTLQHVVTTGEATWSEDLMLPLVRGAAPEESRTSRSPTARSRTRREASAECSARSWRPRRRSSRNGACGCSTRSPRRRRRDRKRTRAPRLRHTWSASQTTSLSRSCTSWTHPRPRAERGRRLYAHLPHPGPPCPAELLVVIATLVEGVRRRRE